VGSVRPRRLRLGFAQSNVSASCSLRCCLALRRGGRSNGSRSLRPRPSAELRGFRATSVRYVPACTRPARPLVPVNGDSPGIHQTESTHARRARLATRLWDPERSRGITAGRARGAEPDVLATRFRRAPHLYGPEPPAPVARPPGEGRGVRAHDDVQLQADAVRPPFVQLKNSVERGEVQPSEVGLHADFSTPRGTSCLRSTAQPRRPRGEAQDRASGMEDADRRAGAAQRAPLCRSAPGRWRVPSFEEGRGHLVKPAEAGAIVASRPALVQRRLIPQVMTTNAAYGPHQQVDPSLTCFPRLADSIHTLSYGGSYGLLSLLMWPHAKPRAHPLSRYSYTLNVWPSYS
jgi:hypothetical protein